ncbi:putative CtpA-like serine protease [Rubripirellula obstinata]|uniref:Putative CtpA-like serine protease n=1 Tax=Rubripirellula obstinata TaxID=406547 RepID=A0A5B1CF36_9BACT|nr:S41 family peptidase [Rubripirellula obstinata]KAA1258359.1 putative CtpA-like serine protease [Rubripirellula obstinata]
MDFVYQSNCRIKRSPIFSVAVLFILFSSFVASSATADVARGADADVAPLQAAEEIDAAIASGLELEQNRSWGEAIRHYEKFTRKYPANTQLYQRMIISRLYYDVNRRYKDESFLQSTAQMSTTSALDLYSEILANLQTHYVEDVDWSRVLIHGTAALEVALNEPKFLDHVLPNADLDRVTHFRNTIHQQLKNRSTATRFDLRASVSMVAQRAQAELGLSGTAVAMEYLGGAVSTLDPYTRLLSPSQLDEMFSNIEGNFVGLGLELKSKKDRLQILSVIPGGPAAEAGIRGGESIVGVNKSRTTEHEPDYVADLLRGPEHSYASIDIVDVNGNERTIEVQRRRVEVPCVENIHFADVDQRIGYLRLTNFQKTTTRDIEKALWDLHRQGMRSLIIDVRGNPGGLLSAAVEVADRFIGEGPIVTTRGRNVRENFDYKAHRPNTWNVPLAVLIDSDSASASEIFAGAIHDSGRGEIVGETSYGKGSVQGIFRMQTAKFGLCLTTAKFYSPSGRAISLNGVEPTIEVEPTYIAARPNRDGEITTDVQDAVLQKAVQQINGRTMISQLP